MSFYTYIMASGRNGTLDTGSTDTMSKRTWEHKEKVRGGFTAEYNVNLLVWYEIHDTRDGAIKRERQIKKWNRLWKIRLIERLNPGWHDLAERFY